MLIRSTLHLHLQGLLRAALRLGCEELGLNGGQEEEAAADGSGSDESAGTIAHRGGDGASERGRNAVEAEAAAAEDEPEQVEGGGIMSSIDAVLFG